MSLELVIALFVAHYVGDFLMQTREIAENKSKRLDCLIIHGLMVAIPMAVVMILLSKTGPMMAIMAVVIYALLHMVQDQFIWRRFEEEAIVRDWKPWGPTFNKWFFRTLGLDQMLHMIVLFVLAFILLL